LGLKLTSLLFISIEAGIIIISAQYKIGRQVISKPYTHSLRSHFFLSIGIRTESCTSRQRIALMGASFFRENGLGRNEIFILIEIVIYIHQNYLTDHAFVTHLISSKPFWL